MSIRALSLIASLSGVPGSQSAAQQFVDVQLVATDTLTDVASAVVDRGRPTIYYNPALLSYVDPHLAQFFLAHEYGHVFFHHTGGALLQQYAGAEGVRRRREQELQADCYATQVMAAQDRGVVDEAIQFFARLGPLQFDPFHPSGAQRAANILSCLPPNGTGSGESSDSNQGRGGTAAAP